MLNSSSHYTLPLNVQHHSQWQQAWDQKRAEDERHQPVNVPHTSRARSSPTTAGTPLKTEREPRVVSDRRRQRGKAKIRHQQRIKKTKTKKENRRAIQRETHITHTRTYRASLISKCWHLVCNKSLPCSSQLERSSVGVVRSASLRRHVPWQHSYLIGSVVVATEASLLSQG